mmetsp:Transcript_22489/g.56843  ORF Transcript_22489/g.56843 Transcript_22489/m.56843 type:complete len:243 (+) Transcript_22489:845-1573(+)
MAPRVRGRGKKQSKPGGQRRPRAAAATRQMRRDRRVGSQEIWWAPGTASLGLDQIQRRFAWRSTPAAARGCEEDPVACGAAGYRNLQTSQTLSQSHSAAHRLVAAGAPSAAQSAFSSPAAGAGGLQSSSPAAECAPWVRRCQCPRLPARRVPWYRSGRLASGPQGAYLTRPHQVAECTCAAMASPSAACPRAGGAVLSLCWHIPLKMPQANVLEVARTPWSPRGCGAADAVAAQSGVDTHAR